MQYIRKDGESAEPVEAMELTRQTTTEEVRSWISEHISKDFTLTATSSDWWGFFMDGGHGGASQVRSLVRGNTIYRTNAGTIGSVNSARFDSNYKPADE